MSRSINKPSEAVAASAPYPGHTDVSGLTPETESNRPIPLMWRVVFYVWACCFAVLVLYEASMLLGRLFIHATN